MLTAATSIATMLALLVSYANAQSAFVNPDHYFDFSTVDSSGSNSFVIDQVTNNPMNSFTFEGGRQTACPGAGLLTPFVGPDGVQFSREKQAIRWQYADNLNLGQRWMMAVWIKAYQGVPTPRNETLLTQARYDNRNETPHAFAFGIFSNPTAAAKVGVRFTAFLYNDVTDKYQYVEYNYQNRMDIQDGWHLLVFGIDNVADPTKTMLFIKMRRGVSTDKEYTTTSWPLKWVQRQQDKQDLYLGGYCDLFQSAATKVYGNPFKGTVSRLYIWRDIQDVGIIDDIFIEKYFFRYNSPATGPTCTDSVIGGTPAQAYPCRFCTVGLNPQTSLTMPTTLYCLSESKTQKQMYIAYWDFNDVNTKQYIDDKTGNGFVLYKGSPIDSEPNEPFRIPGQGYLFENGMFAMAALPILLHNFPQFTFDVWIRREATPLVAPTGVSAFQFLIDKTVSGTYQLDFGIDVQDVNQKIVVTLGNKAQSSSPFTTILKDNTWNYFAVSISRYNAGAAVGCRIRYMGNLEAQPLASPMAASCANGYNDFTITSANTMQLLSFRNYIFNRIRIFQNALSIDDLPMQVKSTSCTKKMGQNQCTQCPDTGLCLTQCNQNQFENPTDEVCTNCHQFCGACSGPGKANCAYCSRSSASPVYYSSLFGNCTCNSGTYYNSTLDACDSCNAQCQECFGKTNLQCLTCKTGQIFYQPTYCVSSCNDPIVKGDGKYGYYMAEETVAGAGTFQMCIKCHPYCTACNGTLVSQCQGCQDGFFLQESTCIDNCPDNQYPDMVVKKCMPCHSDCLKCKSNLKNQCTKCNNQTINGVANTTMKLQGGSCKVQCDAGFWPDTENVCQPCHVACSTCTSARNTTCGSCSTGYFLEWLGFACKFDCVDGKYGDTATNMCLLCHYSCLTCRGAGPDQCKVCAKGYLRRKSLCVSKCEEGEFEVEGACYQCDKKCLTCFGPKDNQCTTCADNVATGLGYYFIAKLTTCTTSCPPGNYPDNFEKVCKPCKTVCKQCTSWDFCTECIDGPYQLNNGECTFFQCMENQYRAVKPTLACYDCDPSCLTCQGMSRFDCLTCKPAHKFQDNSCLTCKDQPGLTESPDPNYQGCIEICGDGFKYLNTTECDDGNLINGDGCDSKCFVEKGWACSGGSKYMPDTCRDIQQPIPKISLINKKNQIYISFSEEVKLTEDLDKNGPKFAITVVGPQPSYKFDWKMGTYIQVEDHIQNFVINLKFYQSLRGTEKVTVRFLNGGTFQDNSGNGVIQVPLTGFLSSFQYLDPFWSNFLDGIADYILFGLGAVAFGNLVAVQVWGVSTTALWTTWCYLQMIMLIPLMPFNWPNFVSTFFGKLGAALNGEISVIPNIIFDMGLAPSGSKVVLEKPLTDRYETFYYEYSNFFYLSGRKILLWGALIVMYPFIWYLKRNYADKHKFCKLWENIELKYRYTLILRAMLLSYVSLLLASTLNIYRMQFVNIQCLVSCFVSIAFQIGFIYLPILIMNILQRSYDRLSHPKFLGQYSTIIAEMDLSHPSKYMFYAVFLMRRIIFVFMLVLFASSPTTGIGAHCGTALLMILYVLIAKPFKRRITAVLTILGELFVIGFHLIGLGILNPDQPDDENTQFGFIVVAMLAVFLLIAFICILVQVISDIVTEWKARSQKSKDIQQKEDEEFKYKKWKKRRQLVKRENALKDRQKLLDQHEDLVNKYQLQQEEEEERRAREEEERERLEAEQEQDEDGDVTKAQWAGQDMSGYMLNGAGYENSFLMQQQQMVGGFVNGWASPGKSGRGGFEDEVPDSAQRLNEKSSRNYNLPNGLQLNKNSGSGEALVQQEGEYEYGEEYYAQDYYGEQEEPAAEVGPPAEEPRPQSSAKSVKAQSAVPLEADQLGEAAQDDGVQEEDVIPDDDAEPVEVPKSESPEIQVKPKKTKKVEAEVVNEDVWQ